MNLKLHVQDTNVYMFVVNYLFYCLFTVSGRRFNEEPIGSSLSEFLLTKYFLARMFRAMKPPVRRMRGSKARCLCTNRITWKWFFLAFRYDSLSLKRYPHLGHVYTDAVGQCAVIVYQEPINMIYKYINI